MVGYNFNKEFTHIRIEKTDDGGGGYKESDKTLATDLKGRISEGGSSVLEEGGSKEAEISGVFYCWSHEDVKRGDRLEADGRRWKIKAVRKPSLRSKIYHCPVIEKQQEESE